MKLTELRLNYFRNYEHGNFSFGDNLNIILGDNGAGKTSLLEAIHYLSLTKSFRTHNNSNVVYNNHAYFQLFGNFYDSKNNQISVNLNYSKNDGKKLFFNHTEMKKKTEIIGKIPLIILSPGNQTITAGGPALRRNFIDRILSQTSNEYLYVLIEFKKRMYQRNLLLSRYRDNKNRYDEYFETIDSILSDHAFHIQKMRIQFVRDFNPVFKKIFQSLSHSEKTVKLKLLPNINADLNQFKKVYMDKLKTGFQRDLKYGRTCFGPQLDQILFIFNKNDIRFTGSQGEQKIFLVALKLAEGIFIEEKLNEKVIFLLDDLFALLDKKHCINIINHIGFESQTFITTTDITVLQRSDLDLTNYNSRLFKLPIGLA